MVYAIGDIHGERIKLERLLDRVLTELNPAHDSLVFLGDYVDRGFDSAGVIDLLMAIRREVPHTIFLRGNHEQMMLDARAFYDRDWKPKEEWLLSPELGRMWFTEGGAETLKSYHQRLDPDPERRWWGMIPDKHWQFVCELPLEARVGNALFVHAGVLPPGVSWPDESLFLEPRLWIREPFISYEGDLGPLVVFGHTPLRRPLVMANKVGVDTGAVFGGRLTCAVIDVEQDAPAVPVRFLQQ